MSKIPRIIHFCWLSGDPYPDKIRRCIESWHRCLPDYEIRLWDFNRFPHGKSQWVDEAFSSRKYAFAADYIRAYALYYEGGIYLDSDVETLKNFDEFLDLPYMLGRESDSGFIEAAVMGAPAGLPIFKSLLEYYDANSFILGDGSFNTTALPRLLEKLPGWPTKRVDIDSPEEMGDDNDTLYLFKPDFFSPIHLVTMEDSRTARTVAVHHFAGTWNSPYQRFKKRLQCIIGPKPTAIIQRIKRFIKTGK